MSDDFTIHEMLEVLLGGEGKRKIRLHRKTNGELFQLYESQLALRHRSPEGRQEAKRVLTHFHTFLGEFPPSPELAVSFLAQFANHKPTTLYRYHGIVKTFMAWYGETLDTKIRLPQTLPDYVEPEAIEKLKEAMASKTTHKKVIARNLLLIDLVCKAGLRRSEISNLAVEDINLTRNYLVVRQGKGMKDRIIDLTPSLRQSFETCLKVKSPGEKIFNLAPATITGVIAWAAKRANVPIHTHSLRHFFGQSLVDTGTDLETVRRLMGHANLKTTQIYLGRTDKQRREAIDRLEKPVDVNHEEPENKRTGGSVETLQSEEAAASPLMRQVVKMEGNPGHGNYFDIPVGSNSIVISDITVRSSNPDVPFKFMIFEQSTSDDSPKDEEAFWVENSSGRPLTLVEPRPQRYEDRDGCRKVHFGLSVYEHPPRFDLSEAQLEEYLRDPVSFDVTLNYTLPA